MKQELKLEELNPGDLVKFVFASTGDEYNASILNEKRETINVSGKIYTYLGRVKTSVLSPSWKLTLQDAKEPSRVYEFPALNWCDTLRMYWNVTLAKIPETGVEE